VGRKVQYQPYHPACNFASSFQPWTPKESSIESGGFLRRRACRPILQAHGGTRMIAVNRLGPSRCLVSFCQDGSGKRVSAFYTIDIERRLVLSSGAGVLTKEDLLGHMERLSKDPDFDPDFCQLVDFTQITALEFEPDDVRQLAQRNIFSPRSRRAFVVKDDLQFGLARMFEIYRELNGEAGIRVFRTFDEAMDWILIGKAAS
jgi:hypothetical protein